MAPLKTLRRMLNQSSFDELGGEMYQLIERLYPICRSITGQGVEDTLGILSERMALDVTRIASGSRAFDWTVPYEWNIRDAYVSDSSGKRVIDFKSSNLHVVSYSRPVHARVDLGELKKHVFSLPAHPDWIPYRTSYYSDSWGFCAQHNVVQKLAEGIYEVRVDSSLTEGHLAYGELLLEGETKDEVLFSTHICHPSLCNDNLSGIALLTALAKVLGGVRTRYSYRFLFVPGTIGSICWLSRNEDCAKRVRHGLVATCVGDVGPFRYKRSRRGDAEIDRVVVHALEHWGGEHHVSAFSPYGYDERQYCSPGFNLAVGSLTRSSHGQYPEYHTSADDLAFVESRSLGESLKLYLRVIACLEGNRRFINTNPCCEPQLGRRGLYDVIGGRDDPEQFRMALLWTLNLCDGEHQLLDVAEKSGLRMDLLEDAAEALLGVELLRPVTAES